MCDEGGAEVGQTHPGREGNKETTMNLLAPRKKGHQAAKHASPLYCIMVPLVDRGHVAALIFRTFLIYILVVFRNSLILQV